MQDSEPNEMTPETKALFEEMQAAANKSDGSEEKITLPPPNEESVEFPRSVGKTKAPEDYTDEEMDQYNKMMEAINNMSLKQLQSFQRKDSGRKKPQKEKALQKRRKAAKAKLVQKKHMKAKGRKKK